MADDPGQRAQGDRAVAALLFTAAATNAMDVYSALNSSPWTAESFGGDPDKAASCREYVYWSIGFTSFFGFTSAWISRSGWPLVGTLIADGFMWWIYERALSRAIDKGSTDW